MATSCSSSKSERRNTVVIEQLVAGLSEGVKRTTDRGRTLFPWLGFKITETNLAGLGIRLSGTALLSEFQQGGRVDLRYPKLIKNEYGLRFGSYFLNGREFYGHRPLVSVPCGQPTCPGTSEVSNAVVRYRRGGFMVGTGKDFTTKLRYSLDWIGDIVSTLDRPRSGKRNAWQRDRPDQLRDSRRQELRFLDTLRPDLRQSAMTLGSPRKESCFVATSW